MQSVSVQNLNTHRTFSTVAKHRLSVCQCVRLSDRLTGLCQPAPSPQYTAAQLSVTLTVTELTNGIVNTN